MIGAGIGLHLQRRQRAQPGQGDLAADGGPDAASAG